MSVTGEPSAVVPWKNCTVPVGDTGPAAKTWAETVMGVLKLALPGVTKNPPGVVLVTVMVTAGLAVMLALKPASPPYATCRGCEPTVKQGAVVGAGVLQLINSACAPTIGAPPASVSVPIATPLSFKVMVPEGKPSGGDALAELPTTVRRSRKPPYCMVVPKMGVPLLVKPTMDVSVVVLFSGVTVIVRALESLAAKVPSPG